MHARRTAGIGAALALAVVCASSATAQVHEGKTIVTAALVASTTAVGRTTPFTLGVHLKVAPGWHVYWENPGDTALPIEIDWKAPAGVRISPLRWPVPKHYTETGGVTVYGYENETVLLATATPTGTDNGPVVIGAHAKWLVCELVCLPGEATLNLTLRRGTPSAAPAAALLSQFERRVPEAAARSPLKVTSATIVPGPELRGTIRIELEGGAVRQFFPRTIPGHTISHGAVVASGGTITIPIEADEKGPAPTTVSGVAVVGAQAFELTAALTAAKDLAPPSVSTSAASAAWLDQPFNISSQDRQLSLGLVLLFALAGGLLLNVMPCVLPVISIKVLGFVQQAKESRAQVRLLGFAFSAGVVASFWVLAAAVWALRAAGEQIGWGFQFQSPGFLVFMTIVVTAFAMNLFGAFEIAGPAIAGGTAAGGAVRGAFWHGALATLLATPCSAPFLGTALGFAFAQSTPAMFATLTAVGVGLALPYLLLSLNSGWLRFVPRPGAWMVRFRQAMGFLLLATAVWLLSVLGAQRGPSAIVATLTLMTAVAFAIWLGAGGGPRLRRHRLVGAAAGILVTSLALVWTARQLADNVSVTVAAAPVNSDGQPWTRFTPAELQRRVESGETVFLDFTAEWCWNCKVNERAVLDTAFMRAEFQRRGVTPMKADWTMRDPDITRLLAKFGRAGVPFYVVFPAGKLTEPIVLSEVITRASVVAALERAGGSGGGDRNSGS